MTEFAWLIECGGSKSDKPLYLCGIDSFGRFKWSYDHNLAVRFSRKQDGEKVARGDHLATDHRVCEHGWDDADEVAAIGAGNLGDAGSDPNQRTRDAAGSEH